MKRARRAYTFFVLVSTLAATMFVPASRPTHADENEQALVSGDTAYLVGRPELVVAGWIGDPYISWDRSTVAFSHTYPWRYQPFGTVIEPEPEKEAPYTLSLVSYSVRREKPVTLWKTLCTEDNWVLLDRVVWLAGGEAAVVEIRNGSYRENAAKKDADGEPERDIVFTHDLLWLNTARQTARHFPLNSNGTIGVYPSPVRPEALVSYSRKESELGTVGMLSASGFGPMKADEHGGVMWFSWDAEGEEIFGLAGNRRAERNSTEEYVAYNRRNRSITKLTDKQEAMRSLQTKYPVTSDPSLELLTERAAITVGTTKRYADCVVAQCGKERVIVAVDAELLALLTENKKRKIVYKTANGVYMVPIFERPYSGYAKHMRESVERSAMGIYNAMLGWMHENQTDTFPKSVDPVKSLVGKDRLKDDLPLRDPLTGTLAFQNLSSGKPDATGKYPQFALQTSFGRLMFYNEEPYFAWDTPEPPTKP